MVLWNFRNHLQNGTLSHPIRLESPLFRGLTARLFLHKF
jgi:hypothetical protein